MDLFIAQSQKTASPVQQDPSGLNRLATFNFSFPLKKISVPKLSVRLQCQPQHRTVFLTGNLTSTRRCKFVIFFNICFIMYLLFYLLFVLVLFSVLVNNNNTASHICQLFHGSSRTMHLQKAENRYANVSCSGCAVLLFNYWPKNKLLATIGSCVFALLTLIWFV